MRWTIFLTPFVIYGVIKVLLLVVGIGLGFLLNWIFGDLDFSIALLMGVFVTAMSFYFFLILMGIVQPFSGSMPLDAEDDPDEPRIVAVPPPPPGPRSKSKSRKRVNWRDLPK